MVARRRHAVIAEHHQQRPAAIVRVPSHDRAIEPGHNLVHLRELGRHQRPIWTADMASVVHAEIVEEQHVPGSIVQELRQMSCHVVVDDDAAV